MNIPIILAHSELLEVYQQQSLPTSWIRELKKAKLFKMFIPEALGGLQLDIRDALIELQSTAKTFPSLGWVHNLVAGANYFCGFFDESTAHILFASPHVMTAGSGTTVGKAEKHHKSWCISGRWSMCSGSQWATHFTGVTTNEKGNLLTFITDSENVVLEKSWQSAGLKMTASDTFVLADKLVPKSQLFEIGKVKSYFYYDLYSMPFDFFARLCLSATFQGVVEGWLKVLHEEGMSSSRTVAIEKQIAQKTITLTQKRAYYINEWNKHYKNTAEKTFEAHYAKELGELHKAIYLDVMHLYYQAGIRASFSESATFQWLVDLQTAVQHFMLKPS